MCHKTIIPVLLLALTLTACSNTTPREPDNLQKAQQTMDCIYTCYGTPNTNLLHENYPFDTNYTASYLASQDTGAVKHFAYLWPFSGTFSAINALLRADKQYLNVMESKVLPALETYYDDSRQPPCYASYLSEAGLSDRFYDDNVWVAIDFVDLYLQTKNTGYLEKSKMVWQFVMSGMDEQLGGGIYWCEQKKHSKNTCSNAPGSVLAFKLFEATRDSLFLHKGLELYHWTKTNLQDKADYLYYDNISLNGHVDKTKYPYNSGQMLQAATLLYKLTNDKTYLTDAQNIAASAIQYFTTDFDVPGETPFRIIKKGDIWFVAVMFRGFFELYHQDGDRQYLDVFNRNLQHAWHHNRDEQGLFSSDWSGKPAKKPQWLLNQAAMVEMYAVMSSVIK